jgi:hypothetical protein
MDARNMPQCTQVRGDSFMDDDFENRTHFNMIGPIASY